MIHLVKTDSRHRVTLGNSVQPGEAYEVQEQEDGSILLIPLVYKRKDDS